MDIALGLFDVTAARAEVVDFTFPVDIMYTRIIVSRGKPEVDPWGFLLPLAPLVWVGLLVSLLAVVAIIAVLSYCLSDETFNSTGSAWRATECIRVALQQGKGLTYIPCFISVSSSENNLQHFHGNLKLYMHFCKINQNCNLTLKISSIYRLFHVLLKTGVRHHLFPILF